MRIYYPSTSSSFFCIFMNFVMTQSTERGKQAVFAKIASNPARLVMDILTLFIFATLTVWVEGKIRLLCFAILLVFTLALGGCIPQPSAALEALRSFQWSF